MSLRHFDIHDDREQNKLGLETYFLDKKNIYDVAIDKQIDELKADVSKLKQQFDGWNQLKDNDPERYKELAEQAERSEINIEHQQFDTIIDILYYEEQLLALVEMKIIYAFKFLEINIKKLLGAAFSLESTKDFYRWDSISKFLKDKDIDVTVLKGNPEIVQLKNVNNAIKHSDDYKTSLNAIQEFKNSNEFTYAKLDQFYNRIKEFPGVFLEELVAAVYKELYTFDDKKIERIAK